MLHPCNGILLHSCQKVWETFLCADKEISPRYTKLKKKKKKGKMQTIVYSIFLFVYKNEGMKKLLLVLWTI